MSEINVDFTILENAAASLKSKRTLAIEIDEAIAGAYKLSQLDVGCNVEPVIELLGNMIEIIEKTRMEFQLADQKESDLNQK